MTSAVMAGSTPRGVRSHTARVGLVIARIWRGAVRPQDADEYVAYIEGTGMAEYRRTPGNRGAWMLRREAGELTEIITSFWDSLGAVRAFAGDDYGTAVFYPEDDRFLVERDLTCSHYEVSASPGSR
jgi:heme-degrading monooxygenase HmoA